MTRYIRNHYNAKEVLQPTYYESNTLPSEFIPDQNLTMAQIFDRYARGLPLSGARVPVFEPDNDLPDPRTLDLVDREQLGRQYAAELQELKRREQQLKIAKGEADKAAQEARDQALLERFKKSLEEKEKPA